MPVHRAVNNFTSGEWSPFLDGRNDLQKYDSACMTLQNFRPLPWGGATYRSGLEFIGLAKFPDRPCRMLPFNYSTTLSYQMEAGDFYIRFWNKDGSPVNVTSAPAIAAATPYAIGAYTEDTGNHLIYYCILGFTTGGGPTQPSADPTHWVQQNIMEVPTVYPYTALNALQLRQLNAQVRFTHPAYPPQTLNYGGPTDWKMGATAFKYPVLLDQNAVQTVLLSLGAISGTTILTSNTAGIFNAQHVGSYWELQQLRPASGIQLDLNNQTSGVQVFSAPIEMEGDWTFTTSQFWNGEVQVQRSVDNGATWVVIRDFTAQSDQNYSTSGTELPPNIGYPPVLYRMAYTLLTQPFDPSVWVGTAPTQYSYAQASLVSQDAYIAALVLVTAFIDSQHVTVTVILPPVNTSTTYLWSEGAFSEYRGYPQAIGFYEQRLLYSGTIFQPNTVWGSVTGDFDNFQYSSDDDGAIAFQPAVCQQNQAGWLASLLRIHLGTSGEEIIMASGDLDEAITPSNVTMRAQSYYGSAPIQPLLVQNSILFVERNGLRVREMRELSPYIVPTDFVAPDLTLLSEHITKPGVILMDFGRLPDPLAYFVRADGVLAVMTYNREQSITAWARYVTAGSFESVSCIFGSPADEVWVSVKRVLNGQTVRTIESFTTDPGENPDIVNNLLLDCGLAFPGAVFPPQASASVPWLANMTVTAVLDGAEYAGLVADNNGTVVFPQGVKASVIRIGLPYTGLLTPMKPEAPRSDGSSQGRKRRVSEVVLRVRNSLSVDYGSDAAGANWILKQFRNVNDTQGSNSPLLGTGFQPNGVLDVPLDGPWPAGNDFSGQVNLRQVHPFPLTVLAIFSKLEITEE